MISSNKSDEVVCTGTVESSTSLDSCMVQLYGPHCVGHPKVFSESESDISEEDNSSSEQDEEPEYTPQDDSDDDYLGEWRTDDGGYHDDGGDRNMKRTVATKMMKVTGRKMLVKVWRPTMEREVVRR